MVTIVHKIDVPPPLDLVSSANVAIGFRKLSSSWMGKSCRIRRSSDNAEQDIGFNGVDFDVAAFNTFVGANTGYITTLYDQSGNGHNFTQTTAALQPVLTLNYKSGRPAANFTAASLTYMTAGTALGKPTNYTVHSVFSVKNITGTTFGMSIYGSINSSAQNKTCWAYLNTSSTGSGGSVGNVAWGHGDGTLSAGANTNAILAANTAAIVSESYASGVFAELIRLNGISKSSVNANGTATSCGGTASNFSIGRVGDWNSNYMDGYMLEFVQYSSQLTIPQQANIELSQNDYFKIF